MSDYVQTTDFSAKDQLASGNPSKIIYGSDIDSELSAIASAITSKSNKVSSATNNNVAKLDSNGDLVDSGYRFSGISGDVSFDLTSLNGKSFASSDDVIDNFPSGTKMLFQQSTAPTGWTKDTTNNDKALRIISGTVGTGGSSPFSTVFGKTATNGHTLTSSESGMPAHKHTMNDLSQANQGSDSGSATRWVNGFGNTDTTTASGVSASSAHSHGMDIRVQYVDVIAASKD